ncbi:MAG: protein-L-isoaspartate(D-aspartate) O-methyltransferase [Euryarchaeota archaeon]|nr:protein-L-isoaspartate(D-aspartate) O-methyltransferase [Euryarchaeota archaeon]
MRQELDEEAFRARRERLVDGLAHRGYVTSPDVLEAMKAVRRHLFVPERLRPDAYDDRPLDIGEGQTISAPHMVGIMAEKLDLGPGQRVLEIGGGSGYHAAVAAHIVGPTGRVFSVERIAPLAGRARRNLEEAGYSKTVTMVVGDGTLGLPEHAPYDRIFVAAASPCVPPPLFEQLREGGKMLVPVGDVYLGQELVMVDKHNGRPVTTEHGGCVFVPLIGVHGFRR